MFAAPTENEQTTGSGWVDVAGWGRWVTQTLTDNDRWGSASLPIPTHALRPINFLPLPCSARIQTPSLSSFSTTTHPIQRAEKKMASSKVFTLEEVAKHSAKEDCWLVIGGKVPPFFLLFSSLLPWSAGSGASWESPPGPSWPISVGFQPLIYRLLIACGVRTLRNPYFAGWAKDLR
jgi:hypothetical protein